jgi:hypothetical protein
VYDGGANDERVGYTLSGMKETVSSLSATLSLAGAAADMGMSIHHDAERPSYNIF